MRTVFITGASTGIGHALAKLYLSRGFRVCSVSRRAPKELAYHPDMIFVQYDLTRCDGIPAMVDELLNRAENASPEIVFLNAGTFGSPPKRADETPIVEFQEILAINLVAVKAVLDACLSRAERPRCVVFSASISALRPRAGMLSYAVSKAAINALAQVYGIENPDIFFAVLGLCNVDTKVAKTIMQADDRFDDLVALRGRAKKIPGYLSSPDERARHLAAILEQRTQLGLQSGLFKEIRELTHSCSN